MRMGAVARLKSMFDGSTWLDIAVTEMSHDPLKFRDERRYTDRLKDARVKTGLEPRHPRHHREVPRLGLSRLYWRRAGPIGPVRPRWS